MASDNKEVALRKRQQIDSSKKTMFIVVAAAAFVAGIALVVSFFLVQQIIFHTKIIGAKQDTLNTIKQNITTVEQLKENIRVMEATDKSLADTPSSSSSNSSAIQKILDALPAEANSDALGSSLQVRFVGPVDSLVVETLQVDNVDIGGSAEGGEATDTPTTEDGQPIEESPSITFRMSVVGSPENMKALLTRFEKSIRVIKLDTVSIQAGDGRTTMDITGRAYYEPGRVITLGTEVIKP